MELFTSDEVLGFIDKFSKTPTGKADIQRYKDAHGIKDKQPFVPKYYDKDKAALKNRKKMKAAAQDFVDILYKHIIKDTVTTGIDRTTGKSYEREGLSNFSKEAIRVSYPHYYSNINEVKINIFIDYEALERQSLVPGQRLNDVVSLFVHGYQNASKSVHGEWHGREIWTPRNKEPNDFVERAVNEFNRKYHGVAFAEPYESYK